MKIIGNKNGLTLMELMMAVVILVPLFTAVMLTFIRAVELSDMARNISTATRGCQDKLAQIETTAFDQIDNIHNNSTFNIGEILNGEGAVYVTVLDTNLLQVTVSYSWRERNGRVIGEDLDLDGNIDAGEDINGNGKLDSTAQLTTYIYNS